MEKYSGLAAASAERNVIAHTASRAVIKILSILRVINCPLSISPLLNRRKRGGMKPPRAPLRSVIIVVVIVVVIIVRVIIAVIYVIIVIIIAVINDLTVFRE